MQAPATGKPGLNDPATWDRMAAFMQEQGLIEKPATPAEAFSNEYLP